MSDAIAEIAAERQRQIEVEGWSLEHDDQHVNGEIADAAACYALGKTVLYNIGGSRIRIWPWEPLGFNDKADRRRQFVIAGALIVAEIERLDRASTPSPNDASEQVGS
jgi:hypothetical protein